MTILIFIAALAVLILSHEFGHFLLAKLSGAKVEEFGIGFPPRLLSFKKGETRYSVNLIPFGGFVKILGENTSEKMPRSFSSRPVYWRAFILSAGVFFNMILAWILFSVVFVVGAPTSVGPEVKEAAVMILEVQANTPAEAAGLQPGDKILGLSAAGRFRQIENIAEAQDFILKHKGEELKIEYARGKELFTVLVVPDPNPPEGIGSLGVILDRVGTVSLPVHKAFWEGARNTVLLIAVIVKSLGHILISLMSGAGAGIQVLGPVGIAGLVGTASELGFVHLLQWIAILSVNLAIINFLPIPALDGGRLLFLAIESIKGSPVNQKVFSIANSVSFAALIALMILITYRDIANLIG
jgi:regulator of sigma E protease